MNANPREIDLHLEHPFQVAPKPGEISEVAAGIHWVRMPMPMQLDHVNLWLLQDGDKWMQVDTGLGNDETKHNWQTIYGHLDAKPHRLICTHYHPDHFGLAGWFEETFDTNVYMTQAEWLTGLSLSALRADIASQRESQFLQRHGAPQEFIEERKQRGSSYVQRIAGAPSRTTRLRDGDQLIINGQRWRIISCEGHAPEHACLYCEDLAVLISGDQVLPRITPNVSTYWFNEGNTQLADFLHSLEKLKSLPASTLVLPSHKLPFIGLHTRLQHLIDHHMERLDVAAKALKHKAMTAMQMVPCIFGRQLTGQHLIFGIGETIAHLNFLVTERRASCEADANGVIHYSGHE